VNHAKWPILFFVTLYDIGFTNTQQHIVKMTPALFFMHLMDENKIRE